MDKDLDSTEEYLKGFTGSDVDEVKLEPLHRRRFSLVLEDVTEAGFTKRYVKRRVRCVYSSEALQDLESCHGIEAVKEFMRATLRQLRCDPETKKMRDLEDVLVEMERELLGKEFLDRRLRHV